MNALPECISGRGSRSPDTYAHAYLVEALVALIARVREGHHTWLVAAKPFDGIVDGLNVPDDVVVEKHPHHRVGQVAPLELLDDPRDLLHMHVHIAYAYER